VPDVDPARTPRAQGTAMITPLLLESDPDYITGRESSRLIGCSPSALMRAALLGLVRVRVELGIPPRYHRDDVLRFAAVRTRKPRKPRPAAREGG
jgi:hypothetical protein